MSKDIVYRQQARRSFLTGLDALANTVKVTLGPRGRNVALERSWGSPTVTKDGVTVAEEIELANKVENLGARLLKEVAQKTNDNVGDGTTSATVLAQAIYREGLKLVEAGFSVMEIKRGIDAAASVVREDLKQQARQATSREDVQHIGTVSANGDETVGKYLADAFEKIGKDGVVTVEESQLMQTEVEIVEGMQFDRGYISPYFITDQERLRVELKDPYILVAEKKITALTDLLPVLEQVRQAEGSLLLIAEDVEGEALAALTVNKLRGVLQAAAVKAPAFGDRRKETLKDIAALVGATAFMEDLGRTVDSAKLSDLGRAGKAILDKESCKIIEGKGSQDGIKARVQLIRREMDETNSTYDKEKLQERLARLSGGVALIRVGGATEAEVRARRHLVEDALAATRAALKEGYVSGGGVALYRASRKVADLKLDSDGERAGAGLLARACEEPLRQIAANAGVDPSVVANEVRQGKGAFGFDAQALEYRDLIEAGIIDPLQVVVTALDNAASIAGLMLTSDAMIVKRPEPEPAQAPGAPGGGMGGMGMGGMGMGGMGGMGMGDMDL